MNRKGRPNLLVRDKGSGGIVSLAVAVVTVIVLLAVLAGVWFRSSYVAYEIVGPSMENTLFDGDWVYGKQTAKAKRGDIVIVDVTDRTEFGDDEAIIKRLIAVGGDTVRCSGGVVYVRQGGGEFEAVDDGSAYGKTTDFGPVVLAQGEIFVMGDNRTESYDSRKVGPLRYDRIVAVVPEWSVAWKGAIGKWETFRSNVRKFLQDIF